MKKWYRPLSPCLPGGEKIECLMFLFVYFWSIVLLNITACANDFTVRALKYRNVFWPYRGNGIFQLTWNLVCYNTPSPQNTEFGQNHNFSALFRPEGISAYTNQGEIWSYTVHHESTILWMFGPDLGRGVGTGAPTLGKLVKIAFYALCCSAWLAVCTNQAEVWHGWVYHGFTLICQVRGGV